MNGGEIWTEVDYSEIVHETSRGLRYKIPTKAKFNSNLPKRNHAAFLYCLKHEWRKRMEHIPRLLKEYIHLENDLYAIH